jgi:hypothetical protein
MLLEPNDDPSTCSCKGFIMKRSSLCAFSELSEVFIIPGMMFDDSVCASPVQALRISGKTMFLDYSREFRISQRTQEHQYKHAHTGVGDITTHTWCSRDAGTHCVACWVGRTGEIVPLSRLCVCLLPLCVRRMSFEYQTCVRFACVTVRGCVVVLCGCKPAA